jgi:hypothetical protein
MDEMTNFKDELLHFLKGLGRNTDILCGTIERENGVQFDLKVWFTKEDFDRFLDALNFEYLDEPFSAEQVHGTIWLKDGRWLYRSHSEYNRCGQWELRDNPPIPDRLK